MARTHILMASILALAIAPAATLTASQARGQQPPPAQKTAPAPDDDFAKGAYEINTPGAVNNTPGLVAPKALVTVMPKYTPEGMRQKIQGTAIVEIIVGLDGSVEKARIKQSLDRAFGLDEAALAAAKQWKFTAGQLNGQPVRVHSILELQFRLH